MSPLQQLVVAGLGALALQSVSAGEHGAPYQPRTHFAQRDISKRSITTDASALSGEQFFSLCYRAIEPLRIGKPGQRP